MDDTKHRGFSLVELLITLAVIALLTGVAAPAMARFIDNARLHAATQQLASELVRARNHAITHQQASYFSLQRDGADWCFGWGVNRDCRCHAIPAENTCTTGTGETTQIHRFRSGDYPGIHLRLPGANSTGRQLRFSPVRGTATAASIILTNRQGEQHVIVSPLGRIRRCTVGATGYARC